MHDLKQPETAAALAEMLRAASAAKQPVELGGRFTKRQWGGPVSEGSLRISTSSLARVLEYEPRDLTISVEAGMPYAELTALLARNNQMIPLDPPYTAEATVGGVVASNQSGPRRRLFGTARDLVIGMQFATMDGRLIQSGGMVVKNVAGLDMGKLMIGSWGTLAAITTLNFKLIPKDKSTRTFVQCFDSAKDALAERNRILQSVLQPAALDILNPDAAKNVGQSGWTLAMGTGGSQALVDRYSRELPSARCLDGAAETAFWARISGFAADFVAANARGAILRVSTVLQGMAEVLETHSGPAIARAANGVAYLYFPDGPTRQATADGNWPEANRSAVWECAPSDMAAQLRWPAPGNALAVMNRIKTMLDPKHLLNKGRLYGRI
ncbi:MAG TPA: FAD-binding oxidoreductase [Bryobacteraceae bacterium]|nr:FAD-binding oxidoreductase [Bryobacteraceae bacterium]